MVALVLGGLACSLVAAGQVDYDKAVADALKTGTPADVSRLCQQWAAAQPHNERPRLILARTLLAAGMPDRALEQFELAVEANPLSPAPHCGIAEVFLLARKPAMAAKELDAALRLDKSCLDALLGKARIGLLEEKPDRALADARKALAAHPTSGRAAAVVAECLLALGKADDALAQASKAAATAPSDADARHAVARACAALGKHDQAQRHWERFLQLEPTGERALRVRNGWVVAHTQRLPAGCDYTPTWSPDGKRLFFGYRELGVIALRDGSLAKLKAPGEPNLYNLDCSPDGKQVVCRKDQPQGQPHVYLYDLHADGTLSPARPEPLSQAVLGRFSPDGRQVLLSAAVVARKDKREGVGLALCDLADGTLRGLPWKLPTRTARNHACWTPDGASIVHHAYGRDGSDRALFFVKLAEPFAPRQLTSNQAMNITPDVSPDSRTVAFTTVRGNAPRTVWLTRADGSSKPVCLGHGTDARWSPDGRSLAYHTYQHNKSIVVAHLTGIDARPLGLAARLKDAQVAVTITSRAKQPLVATVRYQLFGPQSVRIAQGAVGKEKMPLKPDDIIECELGPTPAAKGPCVLKLTAVAADGRRTVQLVDLALP